MRRALALVALSLVTLHAPRASAQQAEAEAEVQDDALAGVEPLDEAEVLAPRAAEEATPEDAAPEDDAAASDAETPTWPPVEPQPPIYEAWWFWTAIASVVFGLTAAIVVGVTTDAPASAVRMPLLRF